MTQEPTPLIDLLLNRARQVLAGTDGTLQCQAATPEAGCVVFIALGDQASRARVVAGRGGSAE